MSVSLQALTADGGLAVTGSLVVSRLAATGPLTVAELRTGVLYAFDERLPVTGPPDVPTLSVPVRVTPASCTGHVIGEVKQPYAFSVLLAFGAADPEPVDVPTTPAQQELLRTLVKTACAGRTS